MQCCFFVVVFFFFFFFFLLFFVLFFQSQDPDQTCADAQADLNLRWAHMSDGTLSHGGAQSACFK